MSRESLANASRGRKSLLRQFPHVDSDALDLFAPAEDVALDAEVVEALAEMQREALEAASDAQALRLPTRACIIQSSREEDALATSTLIASFEGGESLPFVGSVLLIAGLEEATALAIATPTGEVLALEPQKAPLCFHAVEYGMHELRMQVADGSVRICRFMVSSQLGEFTEAFDNFYDTIEWAWDGEWTESLEEAAVNLLVSLDDHFQAMELNNNFLGKELRSSVEGPKKRLEKHLGKLIENHDALVCGRVEACLRSFVMAHSLLDMFGPMMGMNGGMAAVEETSFYQAVLAFEQARLAAASSAKQAEVKAHVQRLVNTADAHFSELHGQPQSQSLVERWHGGLRDTLLQMVKDEAVVHPLPFQQLRGGGGGYMNDMMASMMGSFGGGQGAAVQRAQTTEAMSSLNPKATFEEAEAKVTRWAESLVNESVSFGGPMQSFSLHAGEPWIQTVFAAHQSILSLGFGYVSSGDSRGKDDEEEEEEKVLGRKESASMTILMDRVRASLPLNEENEFLRDRRRRDRLKDVCRVVRAARRKGQKLILSVNSDFAGTLQALQEHHESSWVGPNLEAVWNAMVPEKKVFAFELWLEEAGKKRLVAADFGHPHTNGKAYYVATRFFDRSERTLQPGFILAFAEAACLKQAGVQLWDLGGADASPMMHYKPQVSIEMGRSEFLCRLRQLSEPHDQASVERRRRCISEPDAALPTGGDAIPTGIIFEDLNEEQIWGVAALRAMEERSKSAASSDDAAKKAAKKLKLQNQKAARSAKQPKAQPKEPTSQPTVEQSQVVASQGEGYSKSEPDDKTEFRRQFMVVFQKLLAEGVSNNEAAAQALKVVSQ